MKLLWNGENIEPQIEIQDVIMHDNAGGTADSMEIYIPDPEQAWAKWKPKKGDTIEAVVDGYSTGKMYFDGWKVNGQTYIVMAISIPEKGRTEEFRAWNEAAFLEIFTDVATACGLVGIESYDIQNHSYDRVEQKGIENLAFLKYLSGREGYSFKCNNGKAVVFGEKTFEEKGTVKTLSRDQLIGEYCFKSVSVGLLAKGIMKYYSGGNLIEYEYEAPGIYGGILRMDEHAAFVGEAERYVKAALRRANKWENQGFFPIQLDTTIAAAVNVNMVGLGAADGKWYLERVDHHLLNGYTYCWCRRAIEGGY